MKAEIKDVKFSPIQLNITIESPREYATFLVLFGGVCGDPHDGPRQFTDQIYKVLMSVDIYNKFNSDDYVTMKEALQLEEGNKWNV